MNIATLPAGTPIYITAEDDAEAQRLYGRNQADTDSKGQWL